MLWLRTSEQLTDSMVVRSRRMHLLQRSYGKSAKLQGGTTSARHCATRFYAEVTP
jgi:hypothetical protein